MDHNDIGALGLSEREAGRLYETFAMMPPDVRTALEVGFYDLRVTRLLRRRLDLVSIDLPRRVDDPDKRGLGFASVAALPFADRAFDLVLCTEVLEHLPDAVLSKAVPELQRVSSKYLLCSVPYRQQIGNHVFKCKTCGFTGNCMGHVQSFDERRLLKLFPGMVERRLNLIGLVSSEPPEWIYRFARRMGNVWDDYGFGLCPHCGKTDLAVEENALGFVLRRLLWRLEGRGPSQPAWIVALLEQAGSSTGSNTATGCAR